MCFHISVQGLTEVCVKSESPGLDELTRKQSRDYCFVQFNSMVVVNPRAGGSFRFRVVVLLYGRVVSLGPQCVRCSDEVGREICGPPDMVVHLFFCRSKEGSLAQVQRMTF